MSQPNDTTRAGATARGWVDDDCRIGADGCREMEDRMSHAVERTSPYGRPFVGTCSKCGEPILGMSAALLPCPMDGVVSDEQALLDMIDPKREETPK